jgi:hypothetical protein
MIGKLPSTGFEAPSSDGDILLVEADSDIEFCQSKSYNIDRSNAALIHPRMNAYLQTRLGIFAVTSFAWIAILLFCLHRSSQPDEHHAKNGTIYHLGFLGQADFIECGSTTMEAVERGCKYDILSNHWLPEPCIDQTMIDEYKNDNSWYAYADKDMSFRLSLEAMGTSDFYYTSMRDHIVHCAMMWRKQFRAFIEGGRYYDELITDAQHTHHCSQFLINITESGPDYRRMPIQTFVGHSGCWKRRSG